MFIGEATIKQTDRPHREMYYSFCTPECGPFIDAYLEYRSKSGEKLSQDSYLIRDQFDITDIEQIRNESRGITTGILKVMPNNNKINTQNSKIKISNNF